MNDDNTRPDADPRHPDLHTPISRRTLLRGAALGTAVGAGTLAFGGLPAWARTFPREHGAVRDVLSLPYPSLPAGQFVKDFAPKIEHVVVLMMENHSFDNLLGMVPHQVKGRSNVDGLTVKNGKVTNFNPNSTSDPTGEGVTAFHAASPCQGDSIGQAWNTSHACWNNGKNNGFVEACSPQAMWYFDKDDIPFTYSLVEHFPIGNRYFCSVMAQTYPTRRFLFCATASGLTATSSQAYTTPAANGTFFNHLLQYGISFKDYVEPTEEDGATILTGTPLICPNFSTSPGCLASIVNISEFYKDAAAGTLPSFSLVDPNYDNTSQENPQDIQVGEEFIAKVTRAVMESPQWEKTALFITYDEHGGYYDHVAPVPMTVPDNIIPQQSLANETLVPPLNYATSGFRVPMIVVSPWAKEHYVSNVIQDHTSLTSFIEHKWNLPAMSARDANAHPMTDYFDFKQPAFKKPPKLAAAPTLTKGLAECKKAGYPNPPLPSS